MVEWIKTWLWKRRLQKDEKQVNRKLATVTLDGAKHIGLVVYLYDEEQLKTIEDYVHNLKGRGKDIYLIVFTPGKEAPNYCMPKLYLDFVTKKMVNWFSIPYGKAIKSFQQNHFDIVIDLSLEHHKEILYLMATSRASMRVGLYHEAWTKYYDLMLSKKVNQKPDLKRYISELEKYLNQINTVNHE
ncbi:MAG: DUF6913 domain-containing protein [Bacteroidales bacterium]